MKTPMQELFEKFYTSSIYRCEFTEWIKDNEKTLIQNERKHLVDAYEWGLIDGEKHEKKGYYNGNEFYDGYYIQSEIILKTQKV
jgi:hypothetical protein